MEELKRRSHAQNEMMRGKVIWRANHGWDHLIAEQSADDLTIAEFQITTVRSLVIHNIPNLHIVRSHQMLLLIALVVRLQSALFSPNLEKAVQHEYHIVKKSARSSYRVGTFVNRSVTTLVVDLAKKSLISHVDVVERPQNQPATKVSRSLLCVLAHAGPP